MDTLRITTWNVNGIRAATRKGIADRLGRIRPDVLLLQEVRATPDQVEPAWAGGALEGFASTWNPAQKPGYSGTAAITRAPHALLSTGVGAGPDVEGRVVLVRAGTGTSSVRIASVYLPSGSSGEHRQAEKERWMERFQPWARALGRSRVPTLLCGDMNIARSELDIFHAKSNQNTSGFLPHERAWMDGLVESGWRDVVRERFGQVSGPYTWWSNRGRARELDRGWRIDYVLANSAAWKLVRDVAVHREESLGISDHAPVSVQIGLGQRRTAR